MSLTALTTGPGRTGLLERLLAAVRAEFRTEIYHPQPGDPVFVAPECAVVDCDRVAAQRGLCNGHVIRWRDRGHPAMADFLADSGPPVRGRQALPACRIDGCCYGRFGAGLCSKRYDRWVRAGRPAIDGWDAPALAAGGVLAECQLILLAKSVVDVVAE